MGQLWYERAYRRNVVDMHIDDWDARFLSEFDAETYVSLLQTAGVQSAVVYAHSHVGHCHYPTKVGHPHGRLNGRDIFGEIARACRRANIAVVAYYSLIFNNWAYNTHPDWRIVYRSETEGGQRGRLGVCCPNSSYRDHASAEVRELCTQYEFDGIRFDMTFWPTVCCCSSCGKRFAEEVGGALPRRIDWTDARWVAFQRSRERWLLEFAEAMTAIVRDLKPAVSVEHQSSTYSLPWQFGVTADLRDHCDFLQGDFYGGPMQQSLCCKLLNNLTLNRPGGYETSLTRHIGGPEGNIYKTDALLRMQTYAALANHSAFIFIDSINPDGSLNRGIYETMGRIFEKTRPYENFLGGRLCADVAIYFSTESKFALTESDETNQSVSTNTGSDSMPHTDNALGAVTALLESHIPYDVITRKNLEQLDRYRVIVLPQVVMMQEKEVNALRQWVDNGGALYASAATSLYRIDGSTENEFLLSDLLGVSFQGWSRENLSYMEPTDKGRSFFPETCEDYPLAIPAGQVLIRAHDDTEVLAWNVRTYTDPNDATRFASIHCNPPGERTDYPALTRRAFGRGQAIYVGCELEKFEAHRPVFTRLIKSLLKRPTCVESDAPHCVEITLFQQRDKLRYILSLVNFQKSLPAVAVRDFKLTLCVPEGRVTKIHRLPESAEISYKKRGESVEFLVDRLEEFLMFSIEYESQDLPGRSS